MLKTIRHTKKKNNHNSKLLFTGTLRTLPTEMILVTQSQEVLPSIKVDSPQKTLYSLNNNHFTVEFMLIL